MKLKILLILIGSILFIQSCAPALKMAAVTTSDQKVAYDGTIISQKKHLVSLSPYRELDVAKDKTLFMLVVQNGGEDSINIDNGNISVMFEGNSEEWLSKSINVQSLNDFLDDLADEYSNKEKNYFYSKLNHIKSKLEIQSAMSGSSSSLDSISSSSPRSSSSSSSGVDDIVEPMIEDLNYDIELMRANNELLRESLKEIVLKPQTIVPDNSYSGIVVCDTSAMDKDVQGNFQVTVSLDGEEHRFTFRRGL